MPAGREGQNGLPAMDRQESKPFGPDSKNFTRSWTTVSYSILWVKFRASPAVVHFPLRWYQALSHGKLCGSSARFKTGVWRVVL
jgi:hypothetical protein